MDKKKRFEMAFAYAKEKAYFHTQKELAAKMMATESNVSRALKGDSVVLTDRFLQRFTAAVPGVFNLDWLLYEQGEMLLKQQQPEPTTPTDSIITLAATLIQETELLHRQLSDEIAQVSALRQELTDTLAYLRTNFPTPAYPSTFPSTHYLAEAPDDSKINV